MINWQDDGAAPSLQQFGDAIVSIYVGNSQNQVRVTAFYPGLI